MVGAERSLANLAKRDIAQLTVLVKTRLKQMQYRAGALEDFLVGTRPRLRRALIPKFKAEMVESC